MLFSSTIFLFVFLPIVIGVYFFLLKDHIQLQNIFLLIVSIGFYAWGEPKFVFVMLLSIVANYLFARLIGFSPAQKRKIWLIVSVVFNIGILFVFKYLNFVIRNFNLLLGDDILPQTHIVLPIGISFFTFQAMSYVIDVYRKQVPPQKSILNVALYISFFPQLVAGPIVRYETIGDRMQKRLITAENFSDGIKKFIIGLGKKVIISNQLALVADTAFNAMKNGEDISVLFAWTGAIAYTLQIYFDFDGYSQMAIGLGKIFGFDFPENFNYPYVSKSITEFWRRWHISLSTWFRDYLYIPLGGNRVNSTGKHIRNLFVVWLATGIWHGANWTFVLWGLLYFVLLIFEKYSCIYQSIKKAPSIIQHGYALFIVILSWVIFRADSVTLAGEYILQMFGRGDVLIDQYAVQYLCEYKVFFIIAIVSALSVLKKVSEKSQDKMILQTIKILIEPFVYMFIFIVATVYLVTGGYNPFIYFNF